MNENTLTVIVELKDDLGKELLISLSLNSKEHITEITRVSSADGKDNLFKWLINTRHEIKDVYNEGRTNLWLESRGLQLSKLPTEDSSFNYIISKKDEKINTNKTKFSKSSNEVDIELENLYLWEKLH